jgi:hypothetical protein
MVGSILRNFKQEKMRKILVLSVVAALTITACKKKLNTVSTVVTASYPTITIVGAPYISIPVGGAYTLPSATAYDSFYKERPLVVKNLGTLDNTTPGLYTVTYSAKNSNGFEGTASVYVAVTNVSDTLDLSGWYLRSAVPSKVAFVTKLARGLFMTSNVGGVDTGTQKSALVPAIFVVTSLSTLDFGSQITSVGTLTAASEALLLAPADTELTYIITNPSSVFSNTAVRNFKKQ